ncbi:MAG: hypothetical protein IJP70_06125 [Bacteroidales bacterium]|nr:hypothetical protein [Bacteroidales bacterium]
MAISALSEWIISKINPRQAVVSWLFRLCVVLLLSYLACSLFCIIPVFAFWVMGIYVRNSPFGIAHGKDLALAYLCRRSETPQLATFQGGEDSITPYMLYAGNHYNKQINQQVFKVTDFGIHPDLKTDQLESLQKLIDHVGSQGGGRIFFPCGKYYFNKRQGRFIQINYSHITLEGETDTQGRPLATLVNCGPTSEGHKNPWLSPFFISTGEVLQPSNNFFGLQFRKRQKTFSQSASLSDPGSDGEILTPQAVTILSKPAYKGDSVLEVENTDGIGRYIMLGLYNTTSDGNLIKDILGLKELRQEWTTAHRAGPEQAPSFQWLIEVESIVDSHKLRLARPLLRDFQMEYTPTVFNVEMLEDISICNLCLDSWWNGNFRHHGFPLYYSIKMSQQMDYGWNAINMKRVAHGSISNVSIRNFTNPIYVLDSRNVSVSKVGIGGYDGHQGIKFYGHACDCLFEDITFYSHFADMMGGEGNAYRNVFRNICYLNPVFNPVDYDFHGFSEGPMSPPAYNVFHNIRGFRYMKSAGALFNLPSCAQGNVWHHVVTEGEKKGDILFYAMSYRPKKGLTRLVTALGFTIATVQKTRQFSLSAFVSVFKGKLKSIDEIGVPRTLHWQFFPESYIDGIITTADLSGLENTQIHLQNPVSPSA